MCQFVLHTLMSAAKRLNRSRCHLACGLQGAQQTITRWGPGSPTGKGTSGIIPEYDHACRRSIYSTLFARGRQRCSYFLSLCSQQLSANLTQLILHSLEGVGEFNGAFNTLHITLYLNSSQTGLQYNILTLQQDKYSIRQTVRIHC